MREIAFTLNGTPKRLTVDEDRTLLWVLRDDLGLTGTKFGCGASYCGSCTVLVDGKSVRACSTTMRSIEGKKVVTIEGLAQGDRLHPVQAAFVEHAAFQCGYCTPGMILGAYALLKKTPKPNREQILRGMDDHLCRCGSHTRVVDAIETAAASMKGGTR